MIHLKRKKLYQPRKTIEDLNDTDRLILSETTNKGHITVIDLRLKYGFPHQTIMSALERLELSGFISRPYKGVVISLKFMEENPLVRKKYEALLGVTIV